jgi:hypothetical protein
MFAILLYFHKLLKWSLFWNKLGDSTSVWKYWSYKVDCLVGDYSAFNFVELLRHVKWSYWLTMRRSLHRKPSDNLLGELQNVIILLTVGLLFCSEGQRICWLWILWWWRRDIGDTLGEKEGANHYLEILMMSTCWNDKVTRKC